jgi:hypothetical protein
MRGPAGRTRIYGFVTKEKNYSRQSDISTQDPVLVKKLYSACRVLLPSYMIPKFVVVSSIPPRQSVEPLSAIEAKLCETIAELHGITGISVDMDLFSRVFDSLFSISLVVHFRTIFK